MIIKLKLHGGNISHWDVYIMRVTMSVLPRKKKKSMQNNMEFHAFRGVHNNHLLKSVTSKYKSSHGLHNYLDKKSGKEKITQQEAYPFDCSQSAANVTLTTAVAIHTSVAS
jgi:hypothetical protein